MAKTPLPIPVLGKWIRFKETVNYKKANCNLIQGGKETGKSALTEALATHYAEQHKDCKVLDFWGSRDNEGLSWCRSPYKDGVLFLTGDSVKVRSRWPSVKISDFSLTTCKRYKCIITVSAFYSNLTEEYNSIQKTMDELWKRTSWDHVWTILIRELANLIYSRISVGQDQATAKAYVIYVLREMRHMGYALCADAIRQLSVDIDLRSLADYTFIKACGKEGLPKEMDYLYAYFKPFSVMRMPINQFIIVSRTGTIGRGKFECPPWHKHENENLLKLFNIDIEYGEAPDLNTKAGRINDREHVKIVNMRHEKIDGDPLSFNKLAVRCERGASTVFNVVNFHNTEIEAKGFCEKCRRMNAPLVNTKV